MGQKKALVCCLDSFIGANGFSLRPDHFFSLIHVNIVLLITRYTAHSLFSKSIKLEKYREQAGSATVRSNCAVLSESCIIFFFRAQSF